MTTSVAPFSSTLFTAAEKPGSSTGARRCELAALHVDDLDGRQLRIERGISADVVTTTKTGRSRTLTVGTETARLWQHHLARLAERTGADRKVGPWLFSRRPDHTTRMPCTVLAALFRAFARRHEHGDVTLHRLRHTVATVLVSDGHLLQAQQRLSHRDASTTLRQYCHALPLHDQDIADHLNALLQQHA